MLGAGTGVAPFRGFMQQRAAMAATGRELAPALLFFGCRAPGVDDLYRDEFDTWQAAGVVSIRRAYSRAAGENDEAKGCKHVQDRLWHDRYDVSQLWDNGARVYVCGSRAVGNAINETIMKILKTMTKEKKGQDLSDEEAEAYFAKMRNVRFVADVFD